MHPYYPSSLKLDEFVPNTLQTLEILGGMAIVALVLFLLSYLIISLGKTGRKSSDKLAFCWFVITGAIHIFIEGYWVFNWKTYTKSSGYLDEIWKEYSLADSRYVEGETTVFGIEGITALLVGPLSLLTALLILFRGSSRHFVQVLVSVCQIYGDYLYFFTVLWPGLRFHASDDIGLYYWGYFLALNGLWILIPSMMLSQSFNEISRVFAAQKRKEKML